MRRAALLFLPLLLIPGLAVHAAPPAADAVRFEKVATGYRFTEGPAADAEGNVYFTDIPNQRILRFDPDTGKATVFREGSGRANGLMFARDGSLIACEGGGRRVVRIKDGEVHVLASLYGEKRLNSPNDLALDSSGGFYFTDPRYGRRQQDREIDVEAVYYVAKNGRVHQVIADLQKPNGILLSKDEGTLYVADNRAKLLMAYDLKRPGMPSNGRVFARMDEAARGGPDGLTSDAEGNVYAAGQGRIYVWSPTGELRATYRCPEGPSNCTFAGRKHATLYVTARTSLYRLAPAAR